MIRYITTLIFSIFSIACSTTVQQIAEQQPAEQPISCEAIGMESSVIATFPYIKSVSCFDTSKTSMVYEKELSRSLERQQFSGQVTVSGILHTYWSAEMNKQTGNGEKVLYIFFYPDYSPENQSKFPAIRINNKLKTVSYIVIRSLKGSFLSINDEIFDLRTTNALLTQIKKEFSANSDKFIKYREGHLEQRVLMTIDNFSAGLTGCKGYYFEAQLVRFKADPAYNAEDDNSDLHAIVEQQTLDTICGTKYEPSDYTLSYQVKVPKGQAAKVMSEPNSKSEVLAVLENREFVNSIETINDLWAHVIFDKDHTGAEQIEGYMLRKQLELAY